jgi:hypothetical protein
MSADKQQKLLRLTKLSKWIAYIASVVAGLIAAIGVYTLTDAIIFREFKFELLFQNPLAFPYAIYPIVIALFVLGFASKRLSWKTTRVFITSLIFFFTLPFLLRAYFDSRIGKSPYSCTYDNVYQIKAMINIHIVPVRLSYINVPFRLPDNGFKKRDSIIERNSNILGSDWDEFVKVQRRLYGDNPASMMNLATGYETGRDYLEWWNCYPASTHLDKRSKAIRSVAAGNFVYIPVGSSDDTMAYDMLPYDTSAETVHAAIIYAFGGANFKGKDIWTPTGDPNKPVTLKPDGIPDGVLIKQSVIVDMYVGSE